MDLRTERTIRSITNAFMALRKQKPLEKITIKELSELAYINKATFYMHYHDIYDLSDQLEDAFMNSVIKELSHSHDFLSDPALATKELIDVLISKNDIITTLFSDGRENYFTEKLNLTIQKKINSLYPNTQDDLKTNILLSVIIQGCVYAFRKFDNGKNREEVAQIIGEINECLKDRFLS